MPKKVKPKRRKYTSGVLCRDGAGGALIVFFSSQKRDGVYFNSANQMWWSEDIEGPVAKEWTPKEWKATYKLTPPRKGQAFECDVEL